MAVGFFWKAAGFHYHFDICAVLFVSDRAQNDEKSIHLVPSWVKKVSISVHCYFTLPHGSLCPWELRFLPNPSPLFCSVFCSAQLIPTAMKMRSSGILPLGIIGWEFAEYSLVKLKMLVKQPGSAYPDGVMETEVESHGGERWPEGRKYLQGKQPPDPGEVRDWLVPFSCHLFWSMPTTASAKEDEALLEMLWFSVLSCTWHLQVKGRNCRWICSYGIFLHLLEQLKLSTPQCKPSANSLTQTCPCISQFSSHGCSSQFCSAVIGQKSIGLTPIAPVPL